MGVVLLDASLKAQVINKAFYDIWKIGPADVSVGSPFRALMDVNRHNGIYDVAEDQWEGYVASRLAEIKRGRLSRRASSPARDGRTMIYSVTALSGGKRLVCYYDVTEMKHREADLAEAKDKAAELFSNLRRMVDSMSIGIVVLDADLKTEIINQAFYDLWRIDPARRSPKDRCSAISWRPAEASTLTASTMPSGKPTSPSASRNQVGPQPNRASWNAPTAAP